MDIVKYSVPPFLIIIAVVVWIIYYLSKARKEWYEGESNRQKLIEKSESKFIQQTNMNNVENTIQTEKKLTNRKIFDIKVPIALTIFSISISIWGLYSSVTSDDPITKLLILYYALSISLAIFATTLLGFIFILKNSNNFSDIFFNYMDLFFKMSDAQLELNDKFGDNHKLISELGEVLTKANDTQDILLKGAIENIEILNKDVDNLKNKDRN